MWNYWKFECNSIPTRSPVEFEHVHNLFHISQLQKYIPDLDHVVVTEPIEVTEDLVYEECPIQILDCRIKQLCNKQIPLVKVLWTNYLLRSHFGNRVRNESQVPIPIWGNVTCLDKVHKFRGRNSLRGEDCNNLTLNHAYLFN